MEQYLSVLVLSYLLFFKWSNTCQSWCSHIFCFLNEAILFRVGALISFVFLNGAILFRVGALISFVFLNGAILVRVGALISFVF